MDALSMTWVCDFEGYIDPVLDHACDDAKSFFLPNLTCVYNPKLAKHHLTYHTKLGTDIASKVPSPDSTRPICSSETIPPNSPRLEEGNTDAFPAIMCADQPAMNGTVEDFVDFADELREISKSAGDVNALFRLACVGRRARPKWRFDGMSILLTALLYQLYSWHDEQDPLRVILVFPSCELFCPFNDPFICRRRCADLFLAHQIRSQHGG